MYVLVLLVVHIGHLLCLLVVTTYVSLVQLSRTGQFQHVLHAPIVCGMVSSVEQLREGVVELLVYHGSTRLPPVTTLN